MNPVIGLDISKGKSDGQIFLDKGQPYGKIFRFLHNREGLQQLLNIIVDAQNKTEKSPTVILESTGHYHQAVIQFLEEQHILFLVVNPLISHQAKKSTLRKVKTDAVDAYQLCELSVRLTYSNVCAGKTAVPSCARSSLSGLQRDLR